MTIPYGLLELMRDPVLQSGVTSQAPAPEPPPTPPRPRSIWDAIKGRVDKIRGGLNEGWERMLPVPEGMEGLLSPQAVSSSRDRARMALAGSLLESSGAPAGGGFTPTLGQALGRGLGAARGAFDEGIVGSLQTASAAQSMQDSQRIRQFRESLQQRYQITPDMSRSEIEDVLRRMYAEAVVAGDSELIQRMAQVVSALPPDPGPPVPEDVFPVETVDADGNPVTAGMGRKSFRMYGMLPKILDRSQLMRDQQAASRDIRDFGAKLATEFNNDTKGFREQERTYAHAISLVPAAENGDGIAQMQLMFTLVGSLDDSVVRESEVRLIAETAGVWTQMRNFLDRYRKGDRSFMIPPEVARAMGRVMELSQARLAQHYNERRNYYKQRADFQGVPGSDLLFAPLFQAGNEEVPLVPTETQTGGQDAFNMLFNPTKPAARSGGGAPPWNR